MSPRSKSTRRAGPPAPPPAPAPAESSPLSEYLVAKEPGRRERAENWRVAIGLQKVDGLEVSPYLVETARRNVEGEISVEDARRIVGEYYENKPAATKPDVTINVTINDTKELTDAERTIAGLLRKSPTATRADLSAKSGLSSRQIQRILDSLKSKLGLRRVGSRKTGRWAFPSA